MRLRHCRFCDGIFRPTSPSQRFCSKPCKDASIIYRSQRMARRHAEEKDLQRWRERYEKGLSVCVCRQCCSWFYGPFGSEFCSENCERLWKIKNATEGRKSNADAVSMYKLRECTEAETTRQDRVRMQNRGIPEPYRKSLELAREWAE